MGFVAVGRRKEGLKMAKIEQTDGRRLSVGRTDGLTNIRWSGGSIGLSVVVGQRFGRARGGEYMGASKKVSEPDFYPDWVLCQLRRTNTYVVCRYMYLHTNRAIAVV